MSHLFRAKRLPEPKPSQKISGRLRPKSVRPRPIASRRRAAGPAHHGHAAEKTLGPEGHVARDVVARDLHSPRAEERDANPGDRRRFIARRQDRLLSSTWFPRTSKLPEGPGESARNSTPRQLLWTRFPGNGSPESVANKCRTGAGGLVAEHFRVCMGRAAHVDPASSEPRATSETILVPVENRAKAPYSPLPMRRLSTNVASRAPTANTPWSLKFLTFKPLTPTFFTYSLTLPLLKFTSPRMQMPNEPQGERYLLGGAITALLVPRSEIPFFRITTSSRWKPDTTVVSPACAALMALSIDFAAPRSSPPHPALGRVGSKGRQHCHDARLLAPLDPRSLESRGASS